MAWLQSHQSLRHHPKTRKLARRVGDVPRAVGLLHCLWWWCMDYAPDGDLTKHDAEDIAIGTEWDGDPADLIRHLTECGFLDDDGHLRVHDWSDWAGARLEKLEKDADRNKAMRAAYADGTIDTVRARDGDLCRYCAKTVNWSDRRGPDGATYDHVIPGGPSTVENLVVACRSCNSAKGSRTPTQARMKLNQVGSRSDLGPNQLDRKKEKIDRKKDVPISSSSKSREPTKFPFKEAAAALRSGVAS